MTAFTRAPRHGSADRTPARRLAALGAVAAGALLLGACGGTDDADGMGGMSGTHHAGGSAAPTTSASGAGASAGGFNDADVTFAQMMIPHHQQAVEMAELADGRAADARIKDLAGRIERAQDPEIRTMRGWLTSWGRPTTADGMPGMDMGKDGMMSDQDMKDLGKAKGTAFDRSFARMMIGHHNGAIGMAEDERKNGENTAAKKLADSIVKSQSAEVEQLQAVLDQL